MKVYDVLSKFSAASNCKVCVSLFDRHSGMREDLVIDKGRYLGLICNDRKAYPYGATVNLIHVVDNTLILYAEVR